MKFYHFATILSAFLSQLTVLKLIYSISPREYGQFSLMVVVSQVIFILVLGWNDSLILNFGTKEQVENGCIKRILKVRFLFVIISLLLVLFVFFIVRGSFVLFVKDEKFVSLILVYFFSDFFFNLGSNIFFAKDRNSTQSIFNLLPKIIQFIYIFLFFKSIESYVWFSLWVNLLNFSIILFFYYRLESKQKLSLEKSDLLFFLKFALFQFLSIGSVYIINWGDNFALSFYNVQLEKIGAYNFSYKIFLGFHFCFALVNIIVPKIVYKFKKNGNPQEIESLIKKRRFFVFFVSCFYLMAVFMMKYVLTYLGKQDYLEGIEFAYLLFIPFVFMLLVDFNVPLILNSPFFKAVQLTVFKQALLNVFFNMIFTSFYGIYGVIIGTSIAYFYKFLRLEWEYRANVLVYLNSFRRV